MLYFVKNIIQVHTNLPYKANGVKVHFHITLTPLTKATKIDYSKFLTLATKELTNATTQLYAVTTGDTTTITADLTQ